MKKEFEILEFDNILNDINDRISDDIEKQADVNEAIEDKKI